MKWLTLKLLRYYQTKCFKNRNNSVTLDELEKNLDGYWIMNEAIEFLENYDTKN